MPWRLAAFVFFFLSSAGACADVYTWIDSSGVAHFSDYPPGKIPHKRVDVKPLATVPMSENLRQSERVSGIRAEVRGLLSASDRPGPASGITKAAARARQERACDKYRGKLGRIQSKLRAGYGSDKGNTLRRQRRELNLALSRECILR
ncbi:glycolate oxidase iron-sulfur subunit [Marinobacter salinus]|uniref:Glycolate oxidase iron-sulfur subunit n=1 Tax=Marinobacter salinus TaxID=1874317 RepID=A0A1D9GR43_9GAMM|nr:DUF4124 domain-containing protein [Marinobacter salinus]AOY90015.1 glycolate oxidase iron-sulfur subunit [Marinobacter salinus]